MSLRWPDPAVRFPGPHGALSTRPDRRLALSAIAAHASSRPRAITLQTLAYGAVSALGPRVLGRPLPCPPVLSDDAWAELDQACVEALGPVDDVVVVGRRQRDREGFSAIAHHRGVRRGFIRVRRGPPGLEVAIHAAASQSPPSTFWLPRLVGRGELSGGYSWFAVEPIPRRIHRKGCPPVTEIAAEISTLVEQVSGKRALPSHWRGMHGDLTPWNLRRLGGRYVVLDWEDASYGPPNADLAMYVASRAAIGSRSPVTNLPDAAEARDYWQAVVAARMGGDDQAYNQALSRCLGDVGVNGR